MYTISMYTIHSIDSKRKDRMAEQNNLDREMQNYRKYLQGKTIFCDSDAPETARYAAYLREQSAAWDITAVLGRSDVEHWTSTR